MRRAVMGLAVLACGIVPAEAETLLRMSETARIATRPDELAATLRAEAQSTNAVVAQNAVNAAMAKALAAAKAAPGIVASNGGYQVFQTGQPNPHWQAGQTLDISSGDGGAVLALVGTLQGQGLVVQGLNWRLKAETAREARDKATAKALGALRARAEAAAKILGLSFDSFREVRLDGTQPPRPMARLAMPSMAMAAPVAEVADVDVMATVEADVVLK